MMYRFKRSFLDAIGPADVHMRLSDAVFAVMQKDVDLEGEGFVQLYPDRFRSLPERVPVSVIEPVPSED